MLLFSLWNFFSRTRVQSLGITVQIVGLCVGQRRAKRRKFTLKNAIIRNPRDIIWVIKSYRMMGLETEWILVYPAMNDPEISIQRKFKGAH